MSRHLPGLASSCMWSQDGAHLIQGRTGRRWRGGPQLAASRRLIRPSLTPAGVLVVVVAAHHAHLPSGRPPMVQVRYLSV